MDVGINDEVRAEQVQDSLGHQSVGSLLVSIDIMQSSLNGQQVNGFVHVSPLASSINMWFMVMIMVS
jgi:hypothetical protein